MAGWGRTVATQVSRAIAHAFPAQGPPQGNVPRVTTVLYYRMTAAWLAIAPARPARVRRPMNAIHATLACI